MQHTLWGECIPLCKTLVLNGGGGGGVFTESECVFIPTSPYSQRPVDNIASLTLYVLLVICICRYTLAVYKPDGHCAERCDNDRIPWHKRLGSLHQPAKLSWQVVPEVERTIMETFETLIKVI